LLDAGASVVAVEPDPALAAHLRARFPPPAALDVRVSAFEDVAVDDDSFDVGAAATSFHWIEPGVGLAKVRRALRPGGWWAMWWTVFGDPELPDPFHDATFGLLGQLPGGPSAGARGVPFALDPDERVEDLAAAGFEAIAFERLTWTLTLTTAGVGALYATFSPISRLDPEPRAAVLERLEAIADHDFGGRVDRQVVTPVYTARNSARG
jgi:SAM-dependent methyltransferase